MDGYKMIDYENVRDHCVVCASLSKSSINFPCNHCSALNNGETSYFKLDANKLAEVVADVKEDINGYFNNRKKGQ